MKSGDIRNFFFAANSNKSKPPSANKPPSSGNSQSSNAQEPEKKKTHPEISKAAEDTKKRKSDLLDQDVPKQHEQKKRLKRLSDNDGFEEDAERIDVHLGKAPTKPTYTDNDLDKFKFGDKPKKNPGETSQIKRAATQVPKPVNTAPPRRKSPSPQGKGYKGMNVESYEGESDVTEKLSDDDDHSDKDRNVRTSLAPPKKDDKPRSLKDIANQYKKASPAPKRDLLDDDDEDEDDGGKKRGKTPSKGGVSGATKSKGSAKKGKIQEETIQGPFSGQTIVVTGLLDSMSRDDLTNLLKMLGAKVTGSVSTKTTMLIVGNVLEGGRPVETSKKYQTAKAKGTKIYTETEFDDLLEKKTGKRFIDGVDAIVDGASGGGKPSAGSASKTSKPAQPTPTKLPKPKKPGEKSTELWTEKYAPETVNEVIGNQNFIKDIVSWLEDWEVVVLFGQKKEVKFNPNKSKDNWATSNVNARACLVSGPPGIGKTTSIRLIAKKMGYDIIEQNASDVRNKKAVERLLNDLVNNTLVSYRSDSKNKKFVVLMDEVDGMSAGDRGGNQALINAIKKTKTPIICICNDRQHTKVRSLANHCYDIRFHKPQKQTVAKRMAEIAINEGMKVDLNSLEYLCENFSNDIRQILNYLQMYSRRSDTLTYKNALDDMNKTKKDDTVMLNNFDAARKLMTVHNISIRDKLDLFFIDYDLIPLLVQENYLPSTSGSSIGDLEKVAKAADLVSTGDVINRKIRGNGDWGLMPNFAFVSAIYPCDILRPMVAFPKFPEWLGKNSSSRKKQREVKELRSMMAAATTGNRLSILFDYAPAMIRLINYNLQNETSDDVDTVVEILDHYHLELETVKEHLPDIQLSTSGLKDPLAGVGTQTKALLTRTFNSRHKTSIKAKKAKRVAGGDDGGGEGHRFNPEAEEEEEQEKELGDELEDENEEDEDSTVEISGAKKVKPKAGASKGAPKGSKGGSAGGKSAPGGGIGGKKKVGK